MGMNINPKHVAKAVMGIIALILGKMHEHVEKDENGNPIIQSEESSRRRDNRYPPGVGRGYPPYPPPGPYPYYYGPPPPGYPRHPNHPAYSPQNHRSNTYPINPYMASPDASGYMPPPGSYPPYPSYPPHDAVPKCRRGRKKSRRHQTQTFDPNEAPPAFTEVNHREVEAEGSGLGVEEDEILGGEDAFTFRERRSNGSLSQRMTS